MGRPRSISKEILSSCHAAYMSKRAAGEQVSIQSLANLFSVPVSTLVRIAREQKWIEQGNLAHQFGKVPDQLNTSLAPLISNELHNHLASSGTLDLVKGEVSSAVQQEVLNQIRTVKDVLIDHQGILLEIGDRARELMGALDCVPRSAAEAADMGWKPHDVLAAGKLAINLFQIVLREERLLHQMPTSLTASRSEEVITSKQSQVSVSAEVRTASISDLGSSLQRLGMSLVPEDMIEVDESEFVVIPEHDPPLTTWAAG